MVKKEINITQEGDLFSEPATTLSLKNFVDFYRTTDEKYLGKPDEYFKNNLQDTHGITTLAAWISYLCKYGVDGEKI